MSRVHPGPNWRGAPSEWDDGTLAIARITNCSGGPESRAPAGTRHPARDKAGRILRREEQVAGTVTVRDYAYDVMGRLADVWYDHAMTGLPDEHYGYDLDGNRTDDGTGREFAYAPDDRLLGVGSDGYSFNLRGYLEAKTVAGESTGYVYSWRGELQEVALPDGGWVRYTHDPQGRRIARETRPSGATDYTLQEKYLWNGMTQLLAVLNPDDTVRERFVYADDRVPYLLQVPGSGTTTDYFLMYDQVGSLRVVADAQGSVVKEVVYDSFGRVLSDSNPGFEVPFGFAGGLADADTGLVRFGYRDYLPEIGRWTAKDPIDFAGGDANLYGYVVNDPVGLIDPSGLGGLVTGFELSGALFGVGGRWSLTANFIHDPGKSLLSGWSSSVASTLGGGAAGSVYAANGGIILAATNASEVGQLNGSSLDIARGGLGLWTVSYSKSTRGDTAVCGVIFGPTSFQVGASFAGTGYSDTTPLGGGDWTW